MTKRHTTAVSNRLVAVALAIALLATACGSGVTSVSADRSLEPLPLDGPPGEQVNPDTGASHEYGATIEEWTEVEAINKVGAPLDSASRGGSSDYADIEWADLIPPGLSGEELMARFEERINAAEPGTAEADDLWEEVRAAYDPTAVNTELDGQKIRLAGFVAPLTYDGEIVIEFLLVPTFGACIHVPPPPPNQTVMVSVDPADGLSVEESWGAVWVEGTLVIESASTDLAETSYRITNATSGAYESP